MLQTQVDEESVRRSKLTALIEQYNTTTTTAPPTDTTTYYNNNSTVDIEEGKSTPDLRSGAPKIARHLDASFVDENTTLPVK